jgi:MYXO-CTERM domain-containing protein
MRIAVLLTTLLGASTALGAATEIEVNPNGGGAAYEADYSQAVMVQARLGLVDGAPVAGERVTFRLQRGDDADTSFIFDDPVTDGQGVATARLTLVNGRHGGQSFPGAAPTMDTAGERYVITASFTGDVNAEGCDAADAGPAPDAGADGGVADDTLCDAESTGELFVALEVSTLIMEPGNDVELGGVLQLIATLTDENGDAPQAGTDTDGSAAKALGGRRIRFFYDLDGDGRPSSSERISCQGAAEDYVLTNDQGVAGCDFFADPTFVDTVNVEDGVHAQFGGDDQYTLAGAAQSLTVRPGVPDATRTLLEAEPRSANADGFSLIEVRATLVDGYNNLLGIDEPLYDVSFTTDLGSLEGAAERDAVTGHYLQTIKAPLEGGQATVQIVVEGLPGSDITINFRDQGCSCDVSDGSAPLVPASLFALLLLGLARRRKSS